MPKPYGEECANLGRIVSKTHGYPYLKHISCKLSVPSLQEIFVKLTHSQGFVLRLRLVCFGKPAPRSLEPGLREYTERLDRLCRLDIAELPEERGGSDSLKREATTIRKRLEGYKTWVALDSRGESWSSEKWAKELEIWRRDSHDVGLIIGSADGLHPDILAQSRKVSLGPVTLPHTLARLVLLEQVYRAHTQILGHPYHLGH